MITRKSDWPELLAKGVAEASHRSFEFGAHDCCMFTSSLVLAFSGTDLAAKLRGYKSRAGAIKTLKEKGSGTLLRTMGKVMADHGCQRATHVGLLKRGHVCMAKVSMPESVDESGVEEWAVGVCLGETAVFASDGVIQIPMKEVRRGWHCG